MDNKEKIAIQLEIILGYYNKIYLDKLSIERVLDMLEHDRNYLQQEQNLLDATNIIANTTPQR
jgi:hypothetical protein